MDKQRFLVRLGLLILMAGIAWPVLSRVGPGSLPGDMVLHRGGAAFYFPHVTCIVVSLALSGLLGLFNRQATSAEPTSSIQLRPLC